MESKLYSPDFFREGADTLEKHFVREPQHIKEILDLAIILLRQEADDAERTMKGEKYFAPQWVRSLLNRLGTEEQALSDEEYEFWKSHVSDLSMSDFKACSPVMCDYEAQYATPKEIADTILALKHYFGLV